MTTYNLAPIPFWYMTDLTNKPLSNGWMFSYRDVNRSEEKAIYQDQGGTLIYTQPIYFGQSAMIGPLYFSSDENYFLEIYDSAGQLVRTIPGFNAPQDGSISSITTFRNLKNYILDPYFQFIFTASITSLLTEQQISQSGWFFRKNNTDATDQIDFVDFSVGLSNPANNPTRFLRYTCSVAAVGTETYKDIEFRIYNVRAFSNEVISLGLNARFTAGSDQLSLKIRQHFGTGGAPSTDVTTDITTFTLTGTWAEYQSINFTVPSIGGKTIGTNDDSYISITLRTILNATTTIEITKLRVEEGATLPPYQYLSNQLNASSLVPPWNPLSKNLSLNINGNGILEWSSVLDSFPIGYMLPYFKEAAPSSKWLLLNGQTVLKTDYEELYTWATTGNPIWANTATNLTLPDLRSYFLRIWNGGSSIDPGRLLGTPQADAVINHIHGYIAPTNTNHALGFTSTISSPPVDGNTGVLPNTASSLQNTPGSSETRPHNFSINCFVKALP